MPIITDKMVDSVITLLEVYNGELWESLYWELQDGGLILFVKVFIQRVPSDAELRRIKETLIKVLSTHMPESRTDITWAAAIYYDGKSIGSVVGGRKDS